MAENSTPEERTEAPTERRMGQLRQEGQIFHSTEIVTVISMMTGFVLLTMTVSSLQAGLQQVMLLCYRGITDPEVLSYARLSRDFGLILSILAPDLLIIVLGVGGMSALAVMLQTNWNVKAKWINFRFDFLNPIQGLRRILSLQGFVNTLKAIAKLCIIMPIAYFALREFAPQMVQLVHLSIEQVMAYTGQGVATIFWRIIYVLIALAAFDFFWGREQWLKMNRMTKDEVKDERKSLEGDEETKKKIQQKGLMRIMQRIRSAVPKADVVVTNPTHISVALKYDRGAMGAPTVVAKGKGFLALRIREIAREAGVPVLERKPLARALYESVEVGREIPGALFKAVAEVLAYVYRLRNPYWNPRGEKRT